MTMMRAGTKYQLLQELQGHEDDVRGVVECGEDRIATSSRDKTVKIWRRSGGTFQLEGTLVGHKDFVVTLAYIQPGVSSTYEKGALVSGSRDKTLITWDLERMELLDCLRGHDQQVSCIAIALDGTIVSGSLDGTIRIWEKGKCVSILQGHAGPVLSLAVLPTGDFVSGSGDTTIKIWRDGQCTATLTGHSDSVRSICLFERIGFLSASHDCTLRLWSFDGKETLTMVGHTGLVYSVASLPGLELFVSGSEDQTLRVWNSNSDCLQVIPHPSCVWDVKVLKNGDIVSASGDRVARVWTQDESRVDPDVTSAYNALMKATQTQTQSDTGSVPMKDPSILLSPGDKDGQTVVVNENGNGIVYTWDAVTAKWDKIGEMVGRPEDNMQVSTKLFEGVQYDYIFDVDIADGAPMRKLPYNVGQNPHEVAENWLARENLPMSYREQVVDFILANTASNGPTFVDYNADPFTGGSAYNPSSAPELPGALSPPPQQTLNFAPMEDFLYFDTFNYEGARKKLQSIVESGEGNGITKDMLYGAMHTCKLLAEGSSLGSDEIASFARIALTWPNQNIFPVLDIFRMALLQQDFADYCSSKPELLKKVLHCIEELPSLATLLTWSRLICNSFKHRALHAWLEQEKSYILHTTAENLSIENKSFRLAAATLLLNFCTLAYLKSSTNEVQCISLLTEALHSYVLEDQDAIFRVLVAIATSASHEENRVLLRNMDTLDACRKAATLCTSSSKIQSAFQDVNSLLQ